MSQKDKISVEELLKLKRAERPSEADWRRFDENLRRRMVCRIVAPQESFFLRTFSRISRFGIGRAVSLGAASAAFIAAMVFQLYTASLSGTGVPYAGSQKILRASPLPKVDTSYASNELRGGADFEIPVFALMSDTENTSVRYVEGGFASQQMSF